MQPSSRRALREAAAKQAAVRTRAPWYRRPLLLVLLGLGVVVFAIVGWLGVKAFLVKENLEGARAALTSKEEGIGAAERMSRLAEKAKAAAAASDDPIWHAAEILPWAGSNLRAVRLTASALDIIANDVGMAVFDLQADGQGEVLRRAAPAIAGGAEKLAPIAAELRPIADEGGLVGAVQEAADQALGVADFAGILPDMLGLNGAKRYLLVFQNNAESVSLGGSAASQAMIIADGGDIQIARQASSANFIEGLPVDVPVDDSALTLYSDYLVHHINTTTSRPDFPTAAQLMKAFWQRDIDAGPVDAVISLDPIALGRILLATGPIEVQGKEITSKNAVTVLLKNAYEWWNPYASKAEALASDAFFAGVAATVFEKVASGAFDVKDMLWAVNESVARGDIYAWSDDPVLSRAIDGTAIAGVLPSDNAEATVMGVFFRDTSGSKIDYYMRSAVELTASCTASRGTFTAKTTLHLDISQADADALPRYVKSKDWGSEKFRTEVFVYGPPGTSFVSAEVEGADVRPLVTDVVDLGRPVVKFETFLRPSEKAVVTAQFAGDGAFGPLEARVTPMIKATKVTVDDTCG